MSTVVTADARLPSSGRRLSITAASPSCPRTSTVLREILLADRRCRRRWLRHAQRSSARLPNQAAVTWVLATALWERGDAAENGATLPRSLKDRVSRALTGKLISASTLRLFVDAFEMDAEQEQRLYETWESELAHMLPDQS